MLTTIFMKGTAMFHWCLGVTRICIGLLYVAYGVLGILKHVEVDPQEVQKLKIDEEKNDLKQPDADERCR